MSENELKFGRLLRRRRVEAEKTLGDLSRLLGVTVPYISDVERGRRSPFSKDKIAAITNFLGTDPNELLAAAAVSAGAFELDASVTTRGREVGAMLMRGWNELSDEEFESIAAILEKRRKP